MGTSLVITSGKGGTGKTTAAAAIASFLAKAGHRTLCVDLDAGMRNLDIVLGLSDAVLFDFMDIVEGGMDPEDAVARHPAIENLFFLSAPVEAVDEGYLEKLRALMDDLRERYDFILLDSPAGIGPGFRLAASLADEALIVSACDSSSLRDGQRTALELRKLGIGNIRLIVNRVRPRLLRRIDRDLDDVIDAVGARLLGVVSEDGSVEEAGSRGIPLLLYGSRKAWGQFKDIAARIAGERVRLKV